VRDTLVRWEADGATLSVRAGRLRVLRSAIGWAYEERIIERHPIRTMRGPGRSEPRRPIPDTDVTALFTAASTALLEAVANDTTPGPSSWRRHVAGQDLLLLRLAADTGARRGELAAPCASTTSTPAPSPSAGLSPEPRSRPRSPGTDACQHKRQKAVVRCDHLGQHLYVLHGQGCGATRSLRM
jgi:hypothetical protein